MEMKWTMRRETKRGQSATSGMRVLSWEQACVHSVKHLHTFGFLVPYFAIYYCWFIVIHDHTYLVASATGTDRQPSGHSFYTCIWEHGLFIFCVPTLLWKWEKWVKDHSTMSSAIHCQLTCATCLFLPSLSRSHLCHQPNSLPGGDWLKALPFSSPKYPNRCDYKMQLPGPRWLGTSIFWTFFC